MSNGRYRHCSDLECSFSIICRYHLANRKPYEISTTICYTCSRQLLSNYLTKKELKEMTFPRSSSSSTFLPPSRLSYRLFFEFFHCLRFQCIFYVFLRNSSGNLQIVTITPEWISVEKSSAVQKSMKRRKTSFQILY